MLFQFKYLRSNRTKWSQAEADHLNQPGCCEAFQFGIRQQLIAEKREFHGQMQQVSCDSVTKIHGLCQSNLMETDVLGVGND